MLQSLASLLNLDPKSSEYAVLVVVLGLATTILGAVVIRRFNMRASESDNDPYRYATKLNSGAFLFKWDDGALNAMKLFVVAWVAAFVIYLTVVLIPFLQGLNK